MAETEETHRSGTRPAGECLCGTIGSAFRAVAEAFAPPEEAARHFRDARKEVLLGIRELIDARIERLSRGEAKGSRVVVE
jgi:hypothetical protein